MNEFKAAQNDGRRVTADPAGSARAIGELDETREKAVAVRNGADLVERLAGAASRLRAAEAELVAIVAEIIPECELNDADANLAWAHGYRNVLRLVEGVTETSAHTARGIVAVARHVAPGYILTGQELPPDFPELGAGLAAGAIPLDTARAIVNSLSPIAKRVDSGDLAIAERSLVQMATGEIDQGPGAGIRHSCDLVAAAAGVWRSRLDPDGVEPAADNAHRRRGLWVSRRGRDGLHAVRGHVTTEVAARFNVMRDEIFKTATIADVEPTGAPEANVALDAAGNPTTPCESRASDYDRSPDLPVSARDAVGVRDDRRSIEQIGADLFAAMLTAMAAGGVFATPPPVLVTIPGTRDGKLAGPVGIVEGAPVARSSVDQMACDGGVQPVWLSSTGRVLALESAARVFSANQRRAIAARDGHTCLIPHCTIPAHACEAHHVIPYAQGGSTHVDNGVLLCWSHHRMMDHDYWTVTMQAGSPRVTHSPVRPPRYHPRT